MRLALIGAGPKTLAVLAKAYVLRKLGLEVPEIHVLEKSGVAAHWNGTAGHTDGRQQLGTSPEKDLGFPYCTRVWGAELQPRIDAEMLEFSWMRHLIDMNLYGDWIDRGRPAPEHRHWSRYLVWVAERAGVIGHWHHGAVTGLHRQGSSWRIAYEGGEVQAEGVVVTGPGSTLRPFELPEHPAVLTSETFWPRCQEILEPDDQHLAVVGSGETAAAVSMALIGRGHRITIVSPSGVTYSRGESFRENRLYTDPDGNWTMLTPAHRRDFIRRTDRGVFSQHAMRGLDQADQVELLAGRLVRVLVDNGRPCLELSYDEHSWTLPCDLAVLALGTDPLGPLRDTWLDSQSRAWLCECTGAPELTAEQLESQIDYHLGLRNLEPRLHLPMIAGFAQGPGFPNLSCLGRVSDRILSAYVPLPEAK